MTSLRLSAGEFPVDGELADEYRALARGDYGVGDKGVVAFATYTNRLDEGRGDVYVALGLGRALRDLGWGVRLLPRSEWHREPTDRIDVVIAMLPTFIPGKLPPSTATVVWSRNAADEWAQQPYLRDFDEYWASSELAAQRIGRAAGDAAVTVLPIGVDAQLFTPKGAQRDIDVSTSLNYWGVERAITPAIVALADAHRVVWVGGEVDQRDLGRVERPGAIDYLAMPALYSRSVIVVDDLTAPSLRFGAHNSRLFESIACGAVPITTSRIGLTELGLDAVPVADDAAGLRATVDELLSNPAATAALATTLRATVLERHTFRERAATVDAALTRLVARATARAEPRSSFVRWAAEERAVRTLAERVREIAEAERDDAVEFVADPPTGWLLTSALRRLAELPGRALRYIRSR